MKLALLLLVQALVGLCAAQCQIEANPNSSKSLICGKRGHVTPKVRKYTDYVAPSRHFCTNTCFRTPGCASFSYNRLNQTCSYYLDIIRDKGFRADPKSPLVFFDFRCFRWGSDCEAFANGPFEGPIVDAVPVKKYLPFNRDVKLAPWTVQPFGQRHQSFAYIAKPGSLPAGATPSPDGGNFAVVQLDQEDAIYFVQHVNLKGGTKYRVTFQYSFFNYTGSVPPDPNAAYLISGECRRGYGITFFEYLTPSDPSVVNGEWHQFDEVLTTPENRTGQSCGIYLRSEGNTSQSRAMFGFDSLGIRPEMTSKKARNVAPSRVANLFP